MNCSQEILVAQLWMLFGAFAVVFGDWLARVARVAYWRQGGWRATYASMIPVWSLIAAGIVAIGAAVGLAFHWYGACGVSSSLSGSGQVIGCLSVVLAIVSIVRLIAGRMRIRGAGLDDVPALPRRDASADGDARVATPQPHDSVAVWKAPRAVRRIILEYAVMATAAVLLGALSPAL
jgi:hypothetical protein